MMTYIDKQLSDSVLTVGERYMDKVHGGIVSVIKSYSQCFETFPFVASSARLILRDKLRYDLGGLFVMGWRLLWDRKIRIVHIHTAARGSFDKHRWYVLLARMMGRKVVLHCHASSFTDWYAEIPESHRKRIRKTLSRIHCLIVLSQAHREYFAGIGVDPAKIVVLNNITLPPQKEKVARKPGEPLRLLFLGEIGPRKGVFDLLKAMEILKRDHPGTAFLEIGGNKMQAELEAAIAESGLGDCVHFNGFVSGDAKAGLLSRTDVFVLPSYNEGLPISILEAMSYGCAIVSTPVGGIPEVVKDNGVLVKPGDIDGIASAIYSLSDPEICLRMGAESSRIVQDFYPEAVMARLRQIYLSLSK